MGVQTIHSWSVRLVPVRVFQNSQFVFCKQTMFGEDLRI